MSHGTTHVSLDDLRRFMVEVLEALQVPPADAAIGADVLITADRFGIESHGIQRLTYYVDRIRNGVTDPRTRISVVTDTTTTAVIDGNHGLGHVIAFDAMKRAVAKARDHLDALGMYGKYAVDRLTGDALPYELVPLSIGARVEHVSRECYECLRGESLGI